MQDNRKNYMYLRLSKEDIEVARKTKSESNSISSQRETIKSFIERQQDLSNDFIEMVDDGYSGTNFSRPAITELLDAVKRYEVGTIIVKDFSRLGRNHLEIGYYIENLFPMYDVRLISINDRFDSFNFVGTTAGIDFVFLNLVNEQYSRDISKKIKSVVDRKKRNGEFVYGTAPFGYKKGPQKNTIIVDEEAALVVRYIFWLANNDYTVSQIAAKLNEENIVTPSVYLSKVRGNYKTRSFWTYESVRNIMDNRIYTGDTEAFKSHVVKVGSNKVKQIPIEEREVIANTHEAIISREMYFGANKVINSNVKTKANNPKSILNTYLVCGSCGNRLVKGRYTNQNFKCATARYLPNSDCKNVMCNDKQTQQLVLNAINMQLQVANIELQKEKNRKKISDDKIATLKTKIKQSTIQREKTKHSKLIAYEQQIRGEITTEQFKNKKVFLTDEEKRLSDEISLLKSQIEEIENLGKVTNELSPYLNYLGSTELTEQMLIAFVKEIVIMPDKAINIIWNFTNENATESK